MAKSPPAPVAPNPNPPQISMETMREDLVATSTVLSGRVRTIAAGIVLVWWTSQWGDPPKGHLAKLIGDGMLLPAAIAILTLVFDFLQYLFGYLNSYKIIRAMEATTTNKTMIDPHASLLYIARVWAFWIKLILASVAIGWLAIIVIYYGAHG